MENILMVRCDEVVRGPGEKAVRDPDTQEVVTFVPAMVHAIKMRVLADGQVRGMDVQGGLLELNFTGAESPFRQGEMYQLAVVMPPTAPVQEAAASEEATVQ